MQAFQKTVFQNSSVAFETFSQVIDISRCEGYSFHGVWTNITPALHTFVSGDVNTTTSVITKATHGLVLGMVGRFSTTTTLPTGLALATDYFVTVATSGTYRVATSLVNALAGTGVVISSGGTGTHTFTPTALAGNVKLQGSIDGVVFADISGGSTALSALSAFINMPTVYYPSVRVAVSVTAGAVLLTGNLFAKG